MNLLSHAALSFICLITMGCIADPKSQQSLPASPSGLKTEPGTDDETSFSTGMVNWLTGTSQQQRAAAAAVDKPKEKSQAPADDGNHDRKNAAVVVLQDPRVAMGPFPKSHGGEIDWVQTLEKALIEPRADIQGNTTMVELNLDIIMKNTSSMPWVKFPHRAHTQWLSCANCHPKIFVPKEHENPISMLKILRGEYCGICHGTVAFSPLAAPLDSCMRCHSIPQPTQPSRRR